MECLRRCWRRGGAAPAARNARPAAVAAAPPPPPARPEHAGATRLAGAPLPPPPPQARPASALLRLEEAAQQAAAAPGRALGRAPSPTPPTPPPTPRTRAQPTQPRRDEPGTPEPAGSPKHGPDGLASQQDRAAPLSPALAITILVSQPRAALCHMTPKDPRFRKLHDPNQPIELHDKSFSSRLNSALKRDARRRRAQRASGFGVKSLDLEAAAEKENQAPRFG
jgi:hypothetical protein